MKNDLPYFTHDNDARNHPKMKALRARFGWTGYGQFWALNEMIAGAQEARLDLSRKVVRASVACELGMTSDALDDLLRFLADPDECGLVHYVDGILTTDRTQEDYAKTEAGRLAARERYDRKRPECKTSPENHETSPENCQTSGDLRAKNDREQSRAEQSRIEESRAEQTGARDLSLVDNSSPPAITLEDFADERVRQMRGVRNHGAMVRKLMQEPDVIAAWRKATAPPPKQYPAPPECKCGADASYVTAWPGEAENIRVCQRCKRKYEFDETWNQWSMVTKEAVG